MKSDLIKILLKDIEACIDPLIENDLVKSIPVVENLIALFKFGLSIPDRILFAKIKRFFDTFEPIHANLKAEMLKTFSQDQQTREKIGEIVLLNIDQVDEFEKAELIAMLFICLIYEKIDLSLFKRMVETVNKSFLDDLNDFLSSTYFDDESDNESWQRLSFTGLTVLRSKNTYSATNENFAVRTNFGKKFINTISTAKSLLHD